MRISRPVSGSHCLNSLPRAKVSTGLYAHEVTWSPAGLKATATSPSEWPRSTASSPPPAASQIRTVLSSPPETIRAPPVECQAADRPLMAPDDQRLATGRDVPEADRPVPPRHRDPLAVGAVGGVDRHAMEGALRGRGVVGEAP